jgi:hypothetical protein
VSLHWHIEVEPWVLLHPLLRQDVWNAVMHIDGIRQLNDLEVISPQTLEQWMLPRQLSLTTDDKQRARAPRPRAKGK